MEAITNFYSFLIRLLSALISVTILYFLVKPNKFLLEEIIIIIEGCQPRDLVSNAQIVWRG